MNTQCRVALVGATGSVGQEILSVLEERHFPLESLTLFASAHSSGQTLTFASKKIVVQELTKDSFSNIDIALFSAGSSVSLEFCPIAVQSGAVCVDNTSAFRMNDEVPLVVPEVNDEDVFRHKGIIANPNCSTIQMVIALYPIHKAFTINRLIVSTYQSVSGAGDKAMGELKEQMGDYLKGDPLHSHYFPHPIVMNCIPSIDVFMGNGFTKEEMKMIEETRKILKSPDMSITATAVRVPVMRSHSESINIDLKKTASVLDLKECLKNASGVEILDCLEQQIYPLALDAEGKDSVFVGRIRLDHSVKNSYHLWVVSDNLRKGAALNTVQIAEEILKKGCL